MFSIVVFVKPLLLLLLYLVKLIEKLLRAAISEDKKTFFLQTTIVRAVVQISISSHKFRNRNFNV